MVQAADADDDPIISILDLEHGMVYDPSQCNFEERQIVFLSDRLDQLERFEVVVMEVAITVGGTLICVGIGETA